MYFDPNTDQEAFLTVLDQMMVSNAAGWRAAEDWERFDWSAEFDQTLEQNGFFDCALEESLGTVAATEMVCRLNTRPIVTETAASCLLRPLIGSQLPRPIAVAEGDLDAPIRFLPVAQSVIHLGVDGVRWAALEPGSTDSVESLFAYPMGVLDNSDLNWQTVEADPDTVRQHWRIAVAAEIAGSLKGGLDAVLAHVRDREQFGRPLGSFQAIQHRLAEASVQIEAANLLALKAAQTIDPIDCATALAYAQEASTSIVYDLHQFMGAMGLTLEHPLHRWTYRAKFLRSSLGGAQENHRLVASRRWGDE